MHIKCLTRWYYPAIMGTTTMDPLCEKYYSTSPYAWCGNNPVNYVDYKGDSLSVCSEDRSDVNSYLNVAFGNEIASNFGYTSSNMLVYNGDIEEIKDEETRNLIKNLSEQLFSTSDVISLCIVTEDCVIPGMSIELSSLGGAVYFNSTIYLNKNAPSKLNVMRVLPAYYEHKGIPDGITPMFYSTMIDITPADMFFHEIGEYIYRDATKDKVIDYNNQYRALLGLPNRPYDETHNILIK